MHVDVDHAARAGFVQRDELVALARQAGDLEVALLVAVGLARRFVRRAARARGDAQGDQRHRIAVLRDDIAGEIVAAGCSWISMPSRAGSPLSSFIGDELPGACRSGVARNRYVPAAMASNRKRPVASVTAASRSGSARLVKSDSDENCTRAPATGTPSGDTTRPGGRRALSQPQLDARDHGHIIAALGTRTSWNAFA